MLDKLESNGLFYDYLAAVYPIVSHTCLLFHISSRVVYHWSTKMAETVTWDSTTLTNIGLTPIHKLGYDILWAIFWTNANMHWTGRSIMYEELVYLTDLERWTSYATLPRFVDNGGK